LFASARCGRDESQSTANARIFAANGKTVREIGLGDGIEDLQVSPPGNIWTSYFDEGVFGGDSIAASGLVCWSEAGQPIYTYDADAAGTDTICDCYAMNVINDDDVWIYFYTQFAIVRIRDRARYDVWACPVEGAIALGVHEDRILTSGGYDNHFELHEFELQNGAAKLTRKIRCNKESGQPFSKAVILARGPYFWFVESTRAYRLDMRQA
jgi:hypothetical protein